MASRYIRLVVLTRDKDSLEEQGLFQAAEALRTAGRITKQEEELLQETFGWFNQRLPHPKRFARSRCSGAHKKAISWFKASANEFIRRMEILATILNAYGIHTKRLTTDRPGYLVYEDDYQIVAEPFRGADD